MAFPVDVLVVVDLPDALFREDHHAVLQGQNEVARDVGVGVVSATSKPPFV